MCIYVVIIYTYPHTYAHLFFKTFYISKWKSTLDKAEREWVNWGYYPEYLTVWKRDGNYESKIKPHGRQS